MPNWKPNYLLSTQILYRKSMVSLRPVNAVNVNTSSNKTRFSLSPTCTLSASLPYISSVNQPACHCPWHKMEFKNLLPSLPAMEGTQVCHLPTDKHQPLHSTVPPSQAQPRALGKLPQCTCGPKERKDKQCKSADVKRNCRLNRKYLRLLPVCYHI